MFCTLGRCPGHKGIPSLSFFSIYLCLSLTFFFLSLSSLFLFVFSLLFSLFPSLLSPSFLFSLFFFVSLSFLSLFVYLSASPHSYPTQRYARCLWVSGINTIFDCLYCYWFLPIIMAFCPHCRSAVYTIGFCLLQRCFCSLNNGALPITLSIHIKGDLGVASCFHKSDLCRTDRLVTIDEHTQKMCLKNPLCSYL